jgi:predicted transcriptional regulator
MQMGSPATIAGTGAATDHELVELSADIVSAYVGHNALSVADLPKLIADVHSALKNLRSNGAASAPAELKPAVPIRKSIAPDFLICLEDGKKFKSLKRHLRTHYDLSPEQYREKWGLPADYPMVAPNYSETRSRLAKDNGLGRKAK